MRKKLGQRGVIPLIPLVFGAVIILGAAVASLVINERRVYQSRATPPSPTCSGGVPVGYCCSDGSRCISTLGAPTCGGSPPCSPWPPPTSTPTSPRCVCSDWTLAAGCGGGRCRVDQKYYTRVCSPSRCLSESICNVDSECQAPTNTPQPPTSTPPPPLPTSTPRPPTPTTPPGCTYSDWVEQASCGDQSICSTQCGSNQRCYARTSSSINCPRQTSCFDAEECLGPPPCASPGGPSGLRTTCNGAGTQATVAWNAASGADYYSLRVDNLPNSWGPPASCFSSPETGTGPGDFCRSINTNFTPATSYTFSVNPGQTYRWWISSRVNCNSDYWSAASSSSFVCNALIPTDTSAPPPPTDTPASPTPTRTPTPVLCTKSCSGVSVSRSISQLPNCGEATYTVTANGSFETCGDNLYFPTWSDYNGQNDLNWYRASGNSRSISINSANHDSGQPSTIYTSVYISNQGIYCGGTYVTRACVPSSPTPTPIGPTPTSPPSPINGSCSVPPIHYNCEAGTLGYTAEYPNKWEWWCNGINGGTNVLCAEMKPTPTPTRTPTPPPDGFSFSLTCGGGNFSYRVSSNGQFIGKHVIVYVNGTPIFDGYGWSGVTTGAGVTGPGFFYQEGKSYLYRADAYDGSTLLVSDSQSLPCGTISTITPTRTPTPTTTNCPYYCTDTDGGRDYNTKGFINSNWSGWSPNEPDRCGVLIAPGNHSYRSSCSGADCYLVELYCLANSCNSSPQRDFVECNTCNDGECTSLGYPTNTPTPTPTRTRTRTRTPTPPRVTRTPTPPRGTRTPTPPRVTRTPTPPRGTRTPTPVGPTATGAPTVTVAPNAGGLKFKIQLPDVSATTTTIAASDVQVEVRDGTTSVGVANVDLLRTGNYFQTQSEASFNIPQNKAYTVFIKTKISLGRSFGGVTLNQSQVLDCRVDVALSTCGELITARVSKLLLSGDSDGFNNSSGSYNRVDSADLQVLATYFNQPATGAAQAADFNLDSNVDISDLEILGKNYLQLGD